MMPDVLYYFPASGPCRAVRMAAEKVGLVDLFTGEQNKPEFLAINPQNCVPTDVGRFYLWESSGIRTYHVRKYFPDSSLYPNGAAADRMPYFDHGTLSKAQSGYIGVPADPKKEEKFKKEEFKSRTTYAAGDLHTFSLVGTLSPIMEVTTYHCVPTIVDDGFCLWESHAIMTYLVNKYAPGNSLYPKDPKKRAAVDRMLYFDLGTLYKAQSDYIHPVMFQGRPADPEKEEEFKKALRLFETLLSRTAYAAGDHLTLADYSLVASLSFIVEAADYSLAPYPRVSAWMEKLKKEIPNYEEINVVPLRKFKKFLDSRK